MFVCNRMHVILGLIFVHLHTIIIIVGKKEALAKAKEWDLTGTDSELYSLYRMVVTQGSRL